MSRKIKSRNRKKRGGGRHPSLPQMGGVPGNQAALLKQLEQVQSQMAEANMQEQEFTASAGGGMVTVTALGNGYLTGIEIKPEILDPEDAEMVQDMILAAVNDIQKQIEEAQQGQMEALSQGLPPGLADMLG